MKKLLLVTMVSGSLVLPPPATIPPFINMVTVPPQTIQPEPQVIPIIPAAIGIGVGVGAIGWLGIKALNGVLRIWEHRVTNNTPEVNFTLPIPPLEDDYPE